MSAKDGDTRLTHAALKAKHREIRASEPQAHTLRIHRALSWLDRAEQAGDDHDAAFIFYWIAFNAAYADELGDLAVNGSSERASFDGFFRKMTELDAERRIYNAVWLRFSQSIRTFIDNKYVFTAFWKFHNGTPGYEGWEQSFEQSKRKMQRALENRDTHAFLATLFDRLYVLRNQLVHGGATWNSKVNREQVRDGARILAFMVPLFVDLMMDNPEAGWGKPFYPVVE